MEFGRAFTFAFDDKDWIKKIGIAGLLLIVPILGGLVVMGWALEITRRVIHRESEVLPDWNNFGDYIIKGFMVGVIGFVYTLPIILFEVCLLGGIGAVFGKSDDPNLSAVSVVMYSVICIAIVYVLLALFVLPAAWARFAVTGQLGSAFRFSEVIALVRAAPSAYLIVLLGSIVAGLIADLGAILCIIGFLFTQAYAMVAMAHLWGQAYNVASGGPSMQPVY